MHQLPKAHDHGRRLEHLIRLVDVVSAYSDARQVSGAEEEVRTKSTTPCHFFNLLEGAR